jgi:hypothetical protein
MRRHVRLSRLLLLQLSLWAASGCSPTANRPTTLAQLIELTPSLRDHCHRMQGRRGACARDWACVPGGPRGGCDGSGACTQGGPTMCLPCLDFVALYGRLTRDACLRRAAGP